MDETLTITPETSEAPAPNAAAVDEEKNNNEDEPMRDAAEDPDGSDSDSDANSSDSQSDSDDEAQQNLQLQTLEAELAANPSNYDAHAQYIKVLRKMGDIEKLRKAREAMNELFPLSPQMWREWTKDEASLNTGPEAYSTILKLYDRGVSEYLSVSLWCDYINFVQEFDPMVQQCTPAGITKARDLFERALTAAGLHVAEGNKIWEAYREFEQAILLTIDETDIEEKDKQVQRIRSLFHRQLSIPLSGMSSTLITYKAWEVEQGKLHDVESSDIAEIYPHVVSSYQKALDMYNARAHLEEHIASHTSESEKLQHYMNYVKFEQSSGTPARVLVLYERAVTDLPIASDLWLDYTRYLDKTLKVGNVVTNVYTRAAKNCPWVGELWVRYLLSLERGHASEKEIAAVFEESLQCTFSTLDEYLDLFLTRVDGLRRRMASAGEEGLLEYQIIRQTFQDASDYLSPQLKNTEGLVRLHAYWAHLEAKLGKDITAARGVWESLVKICGSMLEAWKGYIAMEIEHGHINEARSIYKRCYSKRFPGSGSEDICHSWLRFEREFGTLEDYDHALQKVSPRLEELQLYRIQQELKSTEDKEHHPKRNVRDKRKLESDINDGQSPAKRRKEVGKNPKKVPEENKGQENFPQATKVGEANEQINKSEDATKQQSTSDKSRAFSDQCTVFMSNLNLTANYDHIRNFFSDVGGIVAIRILHDKFTGKSRGLAYVDFLDEEHLAAAVAKNKKMLLGKKLSIARSDPSRGRKESSGQRNLKEQRRGTDRSDQAGSAAKESDDASKEAVKETKSANRKPGGDNIQIKGKNTFAVPRNVRALGWTSNKPKTEEDETPKSNDEFRKMFIKKE
ncbi:squamous cell carcinoma antigen recognized by T-cells 3 [Neltuma alba]|uniref:squamous cell carcinoma antigen recognized by T-cells 3 n=1 Tax=Neltuma alba TaxID=207710 RepID=UPI0010A2D90C|nr:squamous cell carcinoma antigen recognized by T-cells 3 [Prosopis alba]